MSNRFWFRLTQVLPIAEHALACPEHRITAAQTITGEPLRPALIWTRSHRQEALASNGVPVWYDRYRDTEHLAAAYTWWHRASGRRGTDEQPHETHRCLPLQARRRDGPPLITLLRDGKRRRMHWFVIDTDPARPERPPRFEVRRHRDQIVPRDAGWRSAVVTATAVAHREYPALIADGYSIRGTDVLPRFDRPTIKQMVADMAAVHADTIPRTDPTGGEHVVLHLRGGAVRVLWEYHDGTRIRLVEHDLIKPDADGRFAVGAYQWPWRIAGK